MKIEAEQILRRHATRNFWLNARRHGVCLWCEHDLALHGAALFVAWLSSELGAGPAAHDRADRLALPPLFMAPLIAACRAASHLSWW